MSTTIEKPRTVAQRGTDATSQLREIFGFEDLKAMSTAIAEAVSEEARHNAHFAERVRMIYQEVVSTSHPTKKRKTYEAKSKVTPIRKVEGYKPDPFAPPDPYFFLQIYGREQFPLALEEQTLTTLKVVADKLMRDNPGTKPTSKAKKDAVIAYIVGIVTGEGA